MRTGTDIQYETVNLGPAAGMRGRLEAGLYVFWEVSELAREYGVDPRDVRLDFQSRVVLAVHLGNCPTGGYSVQVGRVTRDGNLVTVMARVARPGPRDMVTLAWTYPSHAVSLSRRDVGDRNHVSFRCLTHDGTTLGPVRST